MESFLENHTFFNKHLINYTWLITLFNCTEINTYSKGNYGAVLDHILVSPSLIERISKFRIIEEPSDCSDHRPLYCHIKNCTPISSPVNGMESMAKKHKFPWKSSLFTESFNNHLDSALSDLLVCCNSEPLCSDSRLLIDFIFAKIPRVMLTAARKAEKCVGTYTSNGIFRGHFVRCKHSDEIMAIVSELKRLRFGSTNCDRVAELKRKLRFLQRRSIFDRERLLNHFF